ncbi:MAG: peptide ABC transporter substrate-binding protein [Christensenellales bacterium]|jgi:oligopeptide transport system substrate-binding protein
MKKVIALTLTICLALSLMAFAGAEQDTFDIAACIASEPETLDPSLISSVDGSTYVQHMFEGLMKFVSVGTQMGEDESMFTADVDYGQAESYTVSEDGLVYTFTLRDDAVWSDGAPVTAQDFVYSWRRVVDPATAADYGYILEGIVLNASAIQAGEVAPDQLGVEAIDDKTLVVTLESECPYFISLCSFSTLMPLRQDVVEGAENWTEPGAYVSNGAYVLDEWTHDSYLKMVKNASYYDADAIGPDSITWYLSASETSILAAYQAGEYDFIDAIPTDRIEELKASGDAFVVPQMGTYYLYINCEQVDDWRVRAALALAIDRDNIVENVTQGGQSPATGIVPEGILLSDSTEWTSVIGEAMFAPLAELYPDYDLSTYFGRCELAIALVEEAVADGYDATATLDYQFNTSESHKAIAEAVQSDVQNVLGLNMTLSNSEWQTYTDNLGEGGFALARLGWIADFNDAVTYLDLFVDGGSYNYGRWTNPTYTDLIGQIKSMPAGAERDQVMADTELLLFSEGGFTVAPIYFYTQTYAMHEGIENVLWTPLGYFFFHYANQG